MADIGKLRARVAELEVRLDVETKAHEQAVISYMAANARIAELESRIALACEVADSCSGNYMRLILTGEVERADHESRKL